MSVTTSELATRYGVSRRTIFRWKRAGVNVADQLSVGRHVGANPRQPLRILESVADAISRECDRLDAIMGDLPPRPNAFIEGFKSVLQPKP